LIVGEIDESPVDLFSNVFFLFELEDVGVELQMIVEVSF